MISRPRAIHSVYNPVSLSSCQTHALAVLPLDYASAWCLAGLTLHLHVGDAESLKLDVTGPVRSRRRFGPGYIRKHHETLVLIPLASSIQSGMLPSVMGPIGFPALRGIGAEIYSLLLMYVYY